MKSLKNRIRYREGKTDYYCREKLLKDYDHVYRINMGKKENYYWASLGYTNDITTSDRNIKYSESRWLENINNTQEYMNNRKSSYIFGCYYAKTLNQYFKTETLNTHYNSLIKDPKSFMILSLGIRKSIVFYPFLIGLYRTLDQALHEKMRWPKQFKEKEAFSKILETYGGYINQDISLYRWKVSKK